MNVRPKKIIPIRHKKIGIYKITSPIGHIYIGQSKDIELRFNIHKIKLNGNKSHSRLSNSFIEFGLENHLFEVIEICDTSMLNEKERFWQDYFDVLGNKGLNCTLTKSKDKKMIWRQETKESHKRSLKEYYEKNPGIKKGIKKSKQHIENIRARLIGKKASLETKAKLSINRTLNPTKATPVINTQTGRVFKTIKDAAESIGISHNLLGRYIRGERKNPTNFVKYHERV